ncbi:PLP-dependent aminotransferase family protein [Peribacillus frigoritolerans]|uniref:MocR-like pyridoxine biosynthesis transcription factor PdxR n=1 Tax=Peribacillus frigoritolerans TaxID=450367 RepID=UPI00207995FE|nr:PLP-dependent aminotransferase family protein [Peribacillus frigoritolerans]USK82548.1 PLP-dependent aminotransferase family protein [Peribacillus frigoritolerans]
MNLTPLINKNDTRNNPIYVQIYNHCRVEIEENRLEKGCKLPSIRKLAQHLTINKNTVENAYRQLEAEGYIISRQKSGWYVSDLEPDLIKHVKKSIDVSVPLKGKYNNTVSEIDLTYDFRYGKIDTKHFPSTIWRRVVTKSLNNDMTKSLYYGNPQGELPLREEIVRYLYQSRGVRCNADQIVIGSGTQNLLTILTSLLNKYGHKIAFEDPGYDVARTVFQNAGYDVIPIPLEKDGIDINKVQESNARCVFITPSHQFPFGMILPIKKRLHLLKWANKNDGFIIEDDYDGEFRFNGHPIPSLQGMDTNDRVIYLGTFSKSLAPSFCMAYMVLPYRLLDIWNERFALYNSNVSLIQQEALNTFMKDGHWARHLKRMRVLYGHKQEKLLKSLDKYLSNQIVVKGAGSGLHVLIEVPKLNVDTSVIVKKANQLRVGLYSTERYWVNPIGKERPDFLVGFGGINEEKIEEGIHLISSIINENI